MISKTLFRQYDIRGIVNKELNIENTKLIGYFLGLTIKEKSISINVKNSWHVLSK